MVKTGYISFVTETGGGQDASFNPIPVTKVNTIYVECNLMVVKKEYQIEVSGQFRNAKYTIYIDQDFVNPLGIDLDSVKEVQLQDSNTNELGTFQLHNLEYLNLTKRLKLVV